MNLRAAVGLGSAAETTSTGDPPPRPAVIPQQESRVVGPVAVRVQGVSLTYGPVVALQNADLTVRAGVVCGLVGLNGAGKSSLLKVIAGVVPPSAGSVRLFGETPAVAGRQSRIAYTPQSEAIDWDFPISVAEVVLTGRYGQMGWRRRPSDADRRHVAAALAQVELTALAHRQIGQLSGGQRKRVFVARSLAQGASLLVLDEPFAGVDQASQVTLTRVLRGVAARGGTVVIATHDLGELAGLCDEAALIQRTVIRRDRPAVILRPENLAQAFGVGGS